MDNIDVDYAKSKIAPSGRHLLRHLRICGRIGLLHFISEFDFAA
jgi:hypothetical protein